MTENKLNNFADFSVSICVYGGDNPEWFKAAMDSVLNQTVKPSEIVLVVDGPIPETLNAIIDEYEQKPNFKIIRLEVNQGHGNARRIGLAECSFDLVALMDSDDICLPNRFEKQLSAFTENPEISLVGANIAEFVDVETNVVGYRMVPQSYEDICDYLKKRCPFNQVTVMFKKGDVEKVGGYIDWFCEEDYYLWLRMYQAKMRFINLNEILVNVRVGKDMYQRRGGWKYFKSERALQKYMKKNKIIGGFTYLSNVFKRFVVQVLLPNKLRGWIYKKFARTNSKEGQ